MENNYRQYLKINQAAQFLGVSRETLRDWDRSKKLQAFRHPKNKYRLYRISELQKSKENHKRKYHKSKL